MFTCVFVFKIKYSSHSARTGARERHNIYIYLHKSSFLKSFVLLEQFAHDMLGSIYIYVCCVVLTNQSKVQIKIQFNFIPFVFGFSLFCKNYTYIPIPLTTAHWLDDGYFYCVVCHTLHNVKRRHHKRKHYEMLTTLYGQ